LRAHIISSHSLHRRMRTRMHAPASWSLSDTVITFAIMWVSLSSYYAPSE